MFLVFFLLFLQKTIIIKFDLNMKIQILNYIIVELLSLIFSFIFFLFVYNNNLLTFYLYILLFIYIYKIYNK